MNEMTYGFQETWQTKLTQDTPPPPSTCYKVLQKVEIKYKLKSCNADLERENHGYHRNQK